MEGRIAREESKGGKESGKREGRLLKEEEEEESMKGEERKDLREQGKRFIPHYLPTTPLTATSIIIHQA